MSFHLDLSKLNSEQLEAVEFVGAPLLLMAGAGSGKTRVLTTKVAYLIAQGHAEADKILAVTFTNKAAREMKERLTALLPPGVGVPHICTFHSFGLRMLMRNSDVLADLGYKGFPVVADESDKSRIIKGHVQDLVGKENLDATVMRSYTSMVNKVQDFLMHSDQPLSEALRDENFSNLFPNQTRLLEAVELYQRYKKSLVQQQMVDFDDLLMLPLWLMRSFPAIAQKEQNRLQWVLVDEYQDVDTPQTRLVQLLVNGRPNLMVVGDPDQVIYSWRGADVNNMLRFKDLYPQCVEKRLSQNYRSTDCIIQASNRVIKNNKVRPQKELWTKNDFGEPIKMVKADSDLAESSYVVSEIQRLHAEGYRWGDMAILYRANRQSMTFEKELMGRHVPYKVLKGQSFYGRKEVKDLLAYLRLATNPGDFVSYERVANTPARGLGPKALQVLWEKIQELQGAGMSAEDVWATLYGEVSKEKTKAALGAAELSAGLLKVLDSSHDPKAMFDIVLNDLRYELALGREGTNEYDERFDHLMELRAVLVQSMTDTPGVSLRFVLGQLALYTDMEVEDAKADDDRVLLSTLHGTKGLEFPVVFIVGMEKGAFPIELDSDEEMEEERRLFYVGMTRAEERLYLTWAERRQKWGNIEAGLEPSPFFRELPEETYQKYKAADPRRNQNQIFRWF